jgi:putative ABC transport system permease protein
MLSAIAAIVFFVMLLIAGNTMAQSIRERTNELGVLKTIGFTDLTVMGLVLAEALILVGGAGIFGLALAKLATPAFAKLVESFLPIFYVPARSLLVGVGLALLLGLASGGVPAFLALRLSIVDALGRR